MITITITKSAKYFGYIIWSKQQNSQIVKLLNGVKKIRLFFNNIDLGEKNVDWKYHRISIGYRLTRGIPENTENYILTLKENNILKVNCK